MLSIALLPWLPQPALLYNPGPPAQGWHHPEVGLGYPTPITNQENAPTGLPTDQFDRGSFSIEIPSSQVSLACVEVTN